MKELDIQKSVYNIIPKFSQKHIIHYMITYIFQARNCSVSVYKTVPSIGQDRMSQNEVNAFVFPTLSSADDRLL